MIIILNQWFLKYHNGSYVQLSVQMSVCPSFSPWAWQFFNKDISQAGRNFQSWCWAWGYWNRWKPKARLKSFRPQRAEFWGPRIEAQRVEDVGFLVRGFTTSHQLGIWGSTVSSPVATQTTSKQSLPSSRPSSTPNLITVILFIMIYPSLK